MDSDDLPNVEGMFGSMWSTPTEEMNLEPDKGQLDLEVGEDDFTVRIAFKGNMKDVDFANKLDLIVNNMPCLLKMDSKKLKLEKVEPWNSVRVTFNIPREAAERLRLLAQSNNQQLRDLGILSVQIEGEGVINLALVQQRSQEIRVNGPVNQIRMDPGFSLQGGQGLIRVNNPSAPMIPSSSNMAASLAGGGANSELMQNRLPHPSSRPTAQPGMDSVLSTLNIQTAGHPSGSLPQQPHIVQTMSTNRQVAPANLQQHQLQGGRPPFNPAQISMAGTWNQVPAAAIQSPSSQGALGTLANPVWKKAPMPGQMQPQQLQARPPMATVQTPAHPPPPYPFGSQQTSQAHQTFSQPCSSPQFASPPPKNHQGGPPRVPTPLQQPHLTNKSPASSPSTFQQGSPSSSPVNQPQQHIGPRTPQSSSLPQTFQPTVCQSSPSRGPIVQQGNLPAGFMMQANQVAQSAHPTIGGMQKRLPPTFPPGQPNQNFTQAQINQAVASATSMNSGILQVQPNQNAPHTGGTSNVAAQSPMNVQSHGPTNVMQTNLLGLHGNMNNQQSLNTQVNMSNVQGQQGPQSQFIGMHQQIAPSQGQVMNVQSQGPHPPNQMIISRPQLIQNQMMMATSQSHSAVAPGQRMTPPKPLHSQQGQQIMTTHGQLIGPQGQVVLQQSQMMGLPEQIVVSQVQGNKQGFNNQNPQNVIAGPGQMMRGPAVNSQGNMVQFSTQMIQQNPLNGNSQGIGIQGQGLRPSVPHVNQQHGDHTTSASDVNVTQMLPDLQMQQSVVASHLQTMQAGNSTGSHFSTHSMAFSAPYSTTASGSQVSLVTASGFPNNKDVTLTSPLLVNLLQSDITSAQFAMNNKQNSQAINKPKKKKPSRSQKKKNNGSQQAEEQTQHVISDTRQMQPGLDDGEPQQMTGEQSVGIDPAANKLSEFANRSAGFHLQAVDQRTLQQTTIQSVQHPQQQQQQPQQQQQMMMMMMMKQQQQQQQQQHQQQQPDSKSIRIPVTPNTLPPKTALTPDASRMPMTTAGNKAVMVSLPGQSGVPPSPDKSRMPLLVGHQAGNTLRKMPFQENIQNVPSSVPEEGNTTAHHPDGTATELSLSTGSQVNPGPQPVPLPTQVLITGTKPGHPQISTPQGASPQQQGPLPLQGTHNLHFPNTTTTTQTSRPKTPNRASPRPYFPHTPTSRPPSTEPSEISLSPERLNASIAGLFPPQINILLPPRQPPLNRGFDQQGLNPTTLKAIGQAPSSIPPLASNPSATAASQANKLDSVIVSSAKQATGKRASPSTSRRASTGASRKAGQSSGRQSGKGLKSALTLQQNPAIVPNMDVQKNILTGAAQVLSNSVPGSLSDPSNIVPSTQNTPISVRIFANHPEESKEGLPLSGHGTLKQVSSNKEQMSFECSPQGINNLEKKIGPEIQVKKGIKPLEAGNPGGCGEEKSLPPLREVPVSLNQLLDTSGSPGAAVKTTSSNQMGHPIPSGDKEKDESVKEIPSTSAQVICDSGLAPSRPEPGELNSNVTQSGPPRVPTPVVPASISASNPITVFLSSSPIKSASSVTAPAQTQSQPAVVPSVVTMPTLGNKVVSDVQPMVQTGSQPAFITAPVFINTSVFQVVKEPLLSQSATVPKVTLPSTSSLVSQSVTVIQVSHTAPSSCSAVSTTPPVNSTINSSSAPTSRLLVQRSSASPVQPPSTSPAPPTVSSPSPHRPAADFGLSEPLQSNGTVDQSSSASSHPSAVATSPTSASPVEQRKEALEHSDTGLPATTPQVVPEQISPNSVQQGTTVKNGEDLNVANEVAQSEAKNTLEKSKSPTRKNSKSEKESEEASSLQESSENGQRKRASRPGSTTGGVKDTSTATSPTQTKRRKSK
ncbi:nuclear receptor coactivator 6 isoform X2 [Mobula hypostoma]|uniref:nuclear receptor coactivator 6 isoform X2 n=1 Tax=Mobula hypostoma TaxID=723540 RepID=UPI002FC2C1E5